MAALELAWIAGTVTAAVMAGWIGFGFSRDADAVALSLTALIVFCVLMVGGSLFGAGETQAPLKEARALPR